MRPATRVRPAPPAAGRWYRLRGFELAIGFVLGSVPPEPGDRRPPGSPRAALEEVLLRALGRPPCVVSFSGGRDSSAMLALAVHVARRHGLPEPIPVTRRFPDVPAAGEDEWQTLVVRHLGVREWVRLTLRDECDLVGPLARRVLHGHGVVWPPTLHVNIPVFEVARGGTVVTGDGGDEVFGPHRATPLLHVLSGGARRRRGAWRHLPGAIGPARVRRRSWQHEVAAETPAPWLLPPARDRLVRALVDEHLAAPLSWRAAVRRVPLARAWVAGAANRQLLADGYGVQVVHPLLSPGFLRAHAAAGRVLGPLTRAEAMRRLFGDVLPDEVVRRRSKARFNAALLSGPSRRFARRWSGGGLDTDLVDEARLRAEWLSGEPHASSLGLLQAAWLHAHGGQPVAARR